MYSGTSQLEQTLAAGVAALEGGASIPSLEMSEAEMALRLVALEERVQALEQTRGHTCQIGLGKRLRHRIRTVG